jgi:hypothetical protein
MRLWTIHGMSKSRMKKNVTHCNSGAIPDRLPGEFQRYILSQVLDLVDRKTLSRLVERYDAESRLCHFGCRQQLICIAFA